MELSYLLTILDRTLKFPLSCLLKRKKNLLQSREQQFGFGSVGGWAIFQELGWITAFIFPDATSFLALAINCK